MKTNRDLYKAIERLLKDKENKAVPSLETYLSNLISLAESLAKKDSISLEEFFNLLESAFEKQNVTILSDLKVGVTEYEEWKAQILQQIQDLHDMAQQGQLKNEYRYFGIEAPSGSYWYNFDPCTYIECGIAGSFGGWEEDDDTERTHVQGPVAYLDSDGEIKSCNPEDLDELPINLSKVTWNMFSDFIWCGQNYE